MWAIVMGLVCAAGPALAQTETGEEGTAPEEPTGETTEFDAYVAAAAEAFQAKNYADALLNFQRAYELDPDPAILLTSASSPTRWATTSWPSPTSTTS